MTPAKKGMISDFIIFSLDILTVKKLENESMIQPRGMRIDNQIIESSEK